MFVIDSETSGTNPREDRIIELGFQRWTSEGMDKEWRSLINPGIPIPSAATKVHGITDAMVQGCRVCGISKMDHTSPQAIVDHAFVPWPYFKQLATNFAIGFKDCDYAGKYVRFDLQILAAEFARAGVEWSYATARIIDIDRLEAIAEPRTLSDLHRKYVRRPCTDCDGKGRVLDAPDRVLDGRAYEETCHSCKGVGTIGVEHDGAHGALSDVRASTTVIVNQLQKYPQLSRDLDVLHAAQWADWIDVEGKFRFVDGVAICNFGKKYKGTPMREIPVDFYDWILMEDFPADVKALAREAKLGIYPEAKA